VEITPLMSFKHLKMLNSASKCLKIPLKFIVKVIKFFKTRKKNSQKVDGDIKFMPGVNVGNPETLSRSLYTIRVFNCLTL
jgi:hypothetical protein